MKRCDRCQHGIGKTDPNGAAFVECALIPPTPLAIADGVTWVRPSMVLAGWCGQFKLSWKKLLFRDGART